MGRPRKEPTSFADKVKSEMPEFFDSVQSLDVQTLKNRIAQHARDLSESEECKKNDEALKNAQTEAKEYAAPYREVKKAIAMKTKYLLSLIDDKGGA
jgi:hypothetical protein